MQRTENIIGSNREHRSFPNHDFLVGSVSCRLLQFPSHFVAFPRHVQFGENIKGSSEFFALCVTIILFAREKAPIPVAISQNAPVAQLQAERFLFLEQRQGLLQPAPVLQDYGLVAVAYLQAVLVAQLQAACFLPQRRLLNAMAVCAPEGFAIKGRLPYSKKPARRTPCALSVPASMAWPSFAEKPFNYAGAHLLGGRNFSFRAVCGPMARIDGSHRRKQKSKTPWCFKAR